MTKIIINIIFAINQNTRFKAAATVDENQLNSYCPWIGASLVLNLLPTVALNSCTKSCEVHHIF